MAGECSAHRRTPAHLCLQHSLHACGLVDVAHLLQRVEQGCRGGRAHGQRLPFEAECNVAQERCRDTLLGQRVRGSEHHSWAVKLHTPVSRASATLARSAQGRRQPSPLAVLATPPGPGPGPGRPACSQQRPRMKACGCSGYALAAPARRCRQRHSGEARTCRGSVSKEPHWASSCTAPLLPMPRNTRPRAAAGSQQAAAQRCDGATECAFRRPTPAALQ
jgi:hypothetical protein